MPVDLSAGAEPDLVSRAQRGDMAAFESLVEAHRDRVYALALRLTRSEADAAEVTQETFLSAFQHLDEFRADAAFASWVHRIAANHALMRLRRAKVARAAQEELGAPAFNERGSWVDYPQYDWSRRADEQALDAELRKAIQQAADALPEGYREVFLLRDVEGLSYEQIAEMLEESVGAIKSRLHRARIALRDSIDRFYDER